jgi:hypothetical protein
VGLKIITVRHKKPFDRFLSPKPDLSGAVVHTLSTHNSGSFVGSSAYAQHRNHDPMHIDRSFGLTGSPSLSTGRLSRLCSSIKLHTQEMCNFTPILVPTHSSS